MKLLKTLAASVGAAALCMATALPASAAAPAGDEDSQMLLAAAQAPSAPTSAPAGAIVVEEQTQAALHKALKQAQREATATKPAIVWVPAGTYKLTSTEGIFSNTKLYLHPNARIVSGFAANADPTLLGSPESGVGGYNDLKNIEIRGGVWDLNTAGRTDLTCAAMVLRHGENITISDVTVENCNRHMLNLSASKNVTVRNSVFRNPSIKVPGAFSGDPNGREVIHLDNATVEHEGYAAGPAADGTPAGNVTVENNLFENVFAGVGNHHTLEGNAYRFPGTALTVTGNTFRNVVGSNVNIFSMDNVTVKGNTVEGERAWTFTQMQDAKNARVENNTGTLGSIIVQQRSNATLTGMTVVPRSEMGLLVQDSSTTVSGLTVNDATKGMLFENSSGSVSGSAVNRTKGAYAIQLAKQSKVDLTNNTISYSAKDGISVFNAGAGISITGNKVLESAEQGITVGGAPQIKITGNTSTSSKNRGTMKDITVWANASGAVIKDNCVSRDDNSTVYVDKNMGASVANNVRGGCQAAQPQPTTPPSGACTFANGKSFKDVTQAHPFCKDISWLATEGITTGWPDGTFRPSESVERAAFAAFLYRMAGNPAFDAPASSPFVDVPTTHPFYKQIAWAANRGITRGYSDGTFRPSAKINRDAIAAFLYRFAGEPKFTSTKTFKDTANSEHLVPINWMATEGISTGWPDGTFRPTNQTERGAIAAFLHRYAEKKLPMKK